MTQEEAIKIVIGIAAQWGENNEENFSQRVPANADHDLIALIAERSQCDFDEVHEMQQLWEAIEVLTEAFDLDKDDDVDLKKWLEFMR